MPTVADIMRIMDQMAPRRLAENWDNVGLHYGDPDWPVSTVFVALDPTANAMEAAISANADMLVTHHPLIFKPVTHIHTQTPVGRVIDLAAKNRIAVFCAHTNLDAAVGGINDVLAGKIGLNVIGSLSADPEVQRYKLVVFAPPGDMDRIFDAVWKTSAGKIGSYSQCAFYSNGVGQFFPGNDSRPAAGTFGRLTRTDETRIEIPVNPEDIDDVIGRIKASHSYETVAYDIYPLYREESGEGLGRIGEFPETRTLLEVAGAVKRALSLKVVKIAGPEGLAVKKAAVCSGGGTGMIGDFLASDAQVYISGDLNHHVALDVVANNRGLIDIGHFTSERLIVPVLTARIEAEAAKASLPVRVVPWNDEPDPFGYV